MKATATTPRNQSAVTTGVPDRKSSPKRTPTASAARPNGEGDHEESIRLAAYAFYEARGHADGHALEDPLAAKALVEQSTAGPASTGIA